MQAVPCWASFVADVKPIIARRRLGYDAAHVLIGSINFAKESNRVPWLPLSDRNGVAQLSGIDPDKAFPLTRSLSGEDTLNQSEQPS